METPVPFMDTAAFLPGYLGDITPAYPPKRPILGIDECLKDAEVWRLASDLVRRRLIEFSQPLWQETWEADGGKFSIPGGVDRDSMLRGPNPFISGVPKRVPNTSWNDTQVVAALVLQFRMSETLVLLSKNLHNDRHGLRWTLNEIVKPALAAHRCFSLVALFRKRKRSINAYCADVAAIIQAGQFSPGYTERYL